MASANLVHQQHRTIIQEVDSCDQQSTVQEIGASSHYTESQEIALYFSGTLSVILLFVLIVLVHRE